LEIGSAILERFSEFILVYVIDADFSNSGNKLKDLLLVHRNKEVAAVKEQLIEQCRQRFLLLQLIEEGNFVLDLSAYFIVELRSGVLGRKT
jgi:hypothetical protein